MSRSLKYAALGLLVLVLYAVIFAPATLVKQALEANAAVTLTEVKGSLWRGSANVSIPTLNLGKVSWVFTPMALLSFELDYFIEMHAATHNFSGHIRKSSDRIGINGDLEVQAEPINKLRTHYNIQISGTLEAKPMHVIYVDSIEHIDAHLAWTGGPVRYGLSGQMYTQQLPALKGMIDSNEGFPKLRVYLDENVEKTIGNVQIPLILGQLEGNGWIKLGITKSFTKLLNQPWPGSEPDHAVVLEVQEKLF